MTKDDLRPGMIVEFRNGELFIVQKFYAELILANQCGWNSLNYYNEDLTNRNCKSHDIMKIMKPNSEHHFCENFWGEALIIWERKEIELTQEEKALIRLLDEKWKWICKDTAGYVYIHIAKPKKRVNIWAENGEFKFLNDINENLKFNFLSWEDDEPTSIDKLREMIGREHPNA